ncbi:YceD family protein [Sphingomonas sp. CJ99]
MTGPEFSRPWRLDQMGGTAQAVSIEADATEREKLARRFDLVAVHALTAEMTVRRDGDRVLAAGRVRATVDQRCIATGDPVPATVDEPVELQFVPQPDAMEDEVEIDESAADTLFYAAGSVDLGEAAAETMALALDPYPRSPAADAALREAGVQREDEVSIGAFSGLKDLLRGQ